MKQEFIFRAMRQDDLDEVMRIQAQAYIEQMIESQAVVAARLEASPETSWVVEGPNGVSGYLMGYCSVKGEVTPWGREFSPSINPDVLYLHDLAICSYAAGNRLGPRLVAHALNNARARKLGGAALVSVQDSLKFWQKLGFVEFSDLAPAQRQHLISYHGPAVYMMHRFA